MRGWLTLNDEEPLPRPVCLNVPANANWLALFTGALFELADSDNYEQFGSKTPDEMAESWLRLLLDLWAIGECEDEDMRAGMLVAFAGQNIPDDFLECDGRSLERALYPELFLAIGYIWGGSGDYFLLPDLQRKALIGADNSGNREIGVSLGEETHVLLSSEIPAHSHPVDVVAGAGGVVGFQAGAFDGGDASTKTNAGGGAHNNMQPSACVLWLIKAR